MNPTQDWREEFRAANPNMSATETENNIDFIESLIGRGRLQGIEEAVEFILKEVEIGGLKKNAHAVLRKLKGE